MSSASRESNVVVSIEILNRNYKISCQPEEVEQLRAAASYLDQRMTEARQAKKNSSTERIAVMVALNLADDLLKLTAGADGEGMGETLSAIDRRISEALARHSNGEQLKLE